MPYYDWLYACPTVPDLSQLDPKVVQLLALQRVQQLLSTKSQDTRTPQYQDTRPPQQQDTTTPQQQQTNTRTPQQQEVRPPQQQEVRPPQQLDNRPPLEEDVQQTVKKKQEQLLLNGLTQPSCPSPNKLGKDTARSKANRICTLYDLILPLVPGSIAGIVA